MYKDCLTICNEREEKLLEYLGADELLLAITKALDVDTKNYIYTEILRDYDISDIGEEEEEEEE